MLLNENRNISNRKQKNKKKSKGKLLRVLLDSGMSNNIIKYYAFNSLKIKSNQKPKY